MVRGIILILAGIGIFIYNVNSYSSKLVIKGTQIDFGYILIGLGIFALIRAAMKRVTPEQKSNLQKFIEECGFPLFKGILLSDKMTATKTAWKQGCLFLNADRLLILGWEDVEALKRGELTSANLEQRNFSNPRSALVDLQELPDPEMDKSGIFKIRALRFQLRPGKELFVRLSQDVDENPKDEEYEKFLEVFPRLRTLKDQPRENQDPTEAEVDPELMERLKARLARE